jgi:Flp pilus assembly protein TadD
LNGARAAFQKALELDPNLAEAHGGLGWVLWHQGQEAEAEKEFTECVRLDPSLKPKLEQRLREAKLKRAAK